jgi:hypothetical protein
MEPRHQGSLLNKSGRIGWIVQHEYFGCNDIPTISDIFLFYFIKKSSLKLEEEKQDGETRWRKEGESKPNGVDNKQSINL